MFISIQIFQFLSDVGGTLGLWLGFSLMTLFEFLEFAVDVLVYGALKYQGKAGNKKDGGRQGGPLHRRARYRKNLSAIPNITPEQRERLQK